MWNVAPTARSFKTYTVGIVPALVTYGSECGGDIVQLHGRRTDERKKKNWPKIPYPPVWKDTPNEIFFCAGFRDGQIPLIQYSTVR